MNFMMHMADGLISIPVGVGVIFYVVIGFLIAYAIKKCNTANLSHKVALMGVMGAFVFAGQMINFTIPGTGSSGHRWWFVGARLQYLQYGRPASLCRLSTYR